ncbi:MAG: glycerophosphodiester phosphodiesterase family protein, partial [Candidatus Thorarchaeota archaeon]
MKDVTMADAWMFGDARPLIMAHRGDPERAPENTLLAMKSALEVGVDTLETDVRTTRDGYLVLFHDDDLRRTTGVDGTVSESTLEELQQLDLGYLFSPDGTSFPFRGKGLSVVTIQQAFEALPDCKFNIDIKSPDGEAPAVLAEAIRDYGREDSVVVASFLPPQLERFRSLMPSVATAAHLPEVRRF